MTRNARGTDPAPPTVNPLDDPAWDERMAAAPGSSFFHGTAWLKVLKDTYGFQPMFLVSRQAEAVETLLPLVEVDSWLTGRRGIALPFADECAPLGSTGGVGELFSQALALAKSRGWRYVECRGGLEHFGAVPASTSFFGHRLDLSGGETNLFAGIEPSVRRAVRKAEQNGVTVTVSAELSALTAFYALLCQTRKKHGLPAQPFRFFANIHRHVLARQLGHVVLARHDGVPVAGAVFFHFGRTALYKYGASDETRQHLRANNLVMWEAIKWHTGQGFAELDFGRTSPYNAGLRRYKLGWGPVERSIDYVRHDLRAGAFVTVPDAASGWHNRLFRALPISLSRLAGSLLYRHVA